MKGVIYARYSIDNQREESIEGQIRECKAFAKKNDIQIIETYIDRAISPPTAANKCAFFRIKHVLGGGRSVRCDIRRRDRFSL